MAMYVALNDTHFMMNKFIDYCLVKKFIDYYSMTCNQGIPYLQIMLLFVCRQKSYICVYLVV